MGLVETQISQKKRLWAPTTQTIVTRAYKEPKLDRNNASDHTRNSYLLRLLRRFWCSGSMTSISILFPPMVFTFSTNLPSTCNFSTSSPPPMLLPLIKMLGTVRLPVLLANSSCNCGPNGCSSSSTTNGMGVILYFSNRISFALREYGQ